MNNVSYLGGLAVVIAAAVVDDKKYVARCPVATVCSQDGGCHRSLG